MFGCTIKRSQKVHDYVRYPCSRESIHDYVRYPCSRESTYRRISSLLALLIPHSKILDSILLIYDYRTINSLLFMELIVRVSRCTYTQEFMHTHTHTPGNTNVCIITLFNASFTCLTSCNVVLCLQTLTIS